MFKEVSLLQVAYLSKLVAMPLEIAVSFPRPLFKAFWVVGVLSLDVLS